MKKSVIKLVCGLIALILAVSYVDVSVFAGEIALDSSDNKTKIIRSGSIGGNIFYELDEEGFLHIWGNGSTPQYYPWALLTPTASPFLYKTGIKEVVIDEGITYLGNEFFLGCTDLVKVKLPESLTAVGIGTFYGCYNLKEVNIPINMKNIPDQTFYECSALKEIDIPSGVNSIGNNVFYRCGLESIKIPSNITYFNPNIVVDCPNIARIINNTNLPVTCPSRNNTVTWYNTETGETITEITDGQANSSRAIYDKINKTDYWQKFINHESYFVVGRLTNKYYLSDDDYARLISNLSMNDKLTVATMKQFTWKGACRGMASWVALKNNGWVSLSSDLKSLDISDEIISKIHYYHLQQFLKYYKNDERQFKGLDEISKIQILKSSLSDTNISIISFAFIDSSGKKVSHAVCGLGIHEVEEGGKTNKGVDISGYSHCAVVYDPGYQDISFYSDSNIYFNDDGTYYIPNYNATNVTDSNNNYICNIVYNEQDINIIDYYSGIKQSNYLDNTEEVLLTLPLGYYEISMGDRSIEIDENGFLSGDCNGVDLIPICDSAEEGTGWITVYLPNEEEYTIYGNKGFDLLAQYEDFSSYTSISSAGRVVIRNNGDIQINADENTTKVVEIGMNKGFCDIPWNYEKYISENGKYISVHSSEQRIIIDGDDLSGTVVEVSGEDENVYSQNIANNVTHAELLKTDEEIIIDQNGGKEDDYNQQIIDGYNVSFELKEIWSGGYNASIKIKNTSEKELDNWKLRFEYDGEISNIWNAGIISHENNDYIIKNVGWNQDILPGQTIEIGFTGIGDFIQDPIDFELIGCLIEHATDDYCVEFNVFDDWGDGCNANMIIKNNTDYTIEDWTLEFDYSGDITNIWDAEIVSHEGVHYVVKNVQYNGNIFSDNSVSIGFISNKSSDTEYPSNYNLYSRE